MMRITARVGRYSVALLVAMGSLWVTAIPSRAGEVAAMPEPAAPAEEDRWEFDIALYGWLPWIELETAGGTQVDLDAGDVLDALDMTAQFEIALRKGRWGFTADVFYADLGIELDGRVLKSLELKDWLVTPRLNYRAWEGDWGWFDIQGGVRFTSIETEVRGAALGFPIVEAGSSDIWDASIGFRGHYNINERWYIGYYAEVGTGDSEFIAQLFCDVGYRFESVDLFLGLRYLYYDYGGDAPLKDMDWLGPLAGTRIRF